MELEIGGIKMNYNEITLEECFIYYHTAKIACECNADEKIIDFYREQ